MPAGAPKDAATIALICPKPTGHASSHGGPPSSAQQHTLAPRWATAVGCEVGMEVGRLVGVDVGCDVVAPTPTEYAATTAVRRRKERWEKNIRCIRRKKMFYLCYLCRRQKSVGEIVSRSSYRALLRRKQNNTEKTHFLPPLLTNNRFIGSSRGTTASTGPGAAVHWDLVVLYNL